ncbi:MAG TPA: molybdenum cofactor biosynthesis protein MoaB [Acidilobales archaeon]|nr:molybdenum cofactor biosynthesis protein MoaB [Acidilobales archaeon]
MAVLSKSHKEQKVEQVTFSLVITSDSILKGLKKDEVSPIVKSRVIKAGFNLALSTVVGNVEEHIKNAVIKALNVSDVVIVTGGTGLSSRDLSIKVIKEISEHEVRGFGELFRYLSYLDVGAYAWLSSASAFVKGGKLIFVLPGHPKAVELALDKLIIPVVAHALWELRR